MIKIKEEKFWGGSRGIKRKKSASDLIFRSTEIGNMCSDYENPTMKPTFSSGRGWGPGRRSLSFITFDLLQSRQEALTWYIACIFFYQFPRLCFLNFPSIRCMLCPINEIGDKPPHLANSGKFYEPGILEAGAWFMLTSANRWGHLAMKLKGGKGESVAAGKGHKHP